MKLVERRYLYPEHLRTLCINHDFYDCGTDSAYENLFAMTLASNGHPKSLTMRDIQSISEDILIHSSSKTTSITHIARFVSNACCSYFFLEEDGEEVLQSKLPTPSRDQIPYTHPSISRLRLDGSIETVVIGNEIPSDTQEIMDLLAALPEDARRTAQIAIRALIAGLTDRSIAGDSLSLRTGSERLATANE